MDIKSEEYKKKLRDKDKFIANMKKIAEKFDLINSYIERGEPIPEELTKNFITFPLLDDPYSIINAEPGDDDEDKEEEDDYKNLKGFPVTHASVSAAMDAVSKDVRAPNVVRDGIVKKRSKPKI